MKSMTGDYAVHRDFMPDISSFSNIFISYSRRDAEFVRKVDAAFKTAGLEVWVDWEDIPLSVDWWEEIKDGIESADVFVFIISPDSVTSEVCRNEIEHAIKHNKRFVPVLYREIDRNALKDTLHPAITSHNWVFFRETDEFEAAFQRLLTTIKADFGHLRTHTRLLVRAREWQENSGDRSRLLSGRELNDAIRWLQDNGQKEPKPTDLHVQYVEASRLNRTRRQQIFALVGAVLVIFVVLSGALFLSLNTVNSLLEITRQSAEESAATARSVSLLVANSETILNDGDTYRALPLALAAVRARPLPIAQMVLASAAYSPGPQHWLMEHADAIIDAAASPVDHTALTAGQDGLISLWDFDSGELLATYRQHERTVNGVAFTPDGTSFASVGSDGQVLLWDMATASARAIVQSSDRATNVDISPDGQWIAASFYLTNGTSATSDDGYRLLVWNLTTGQQSQRIVGAGEWIQSLRFSPDSSRLLSGMSSGRILEWTVAPDPVGPSAERYGVKAVRILTGHREDVLDLSFTSDGRLLSASEDYTILLWDMGTGKVEDVLDSHTDVVTGVAAIPGTDRAFSVSQDRNVIIWNLTTGEPVRIMTGHRALPTTVAVSSDGAHALSGSNSGIGIIWDLAIRDLIQTYQDPDSNLIRRVAYSPDGQRALTGATNGRLVLWDLESGAIVQEMSGHAPAAVYDVAFALGGTVGVSAGSDNLLRVWDLSNGKQIGDALMGHSGSIWDLAISPDGTRALTASQDGSLILWDLQERRVVRSYPDFNSGQRILTVEFAPDGNSAFASSNALLFRFNLLTGAILQSYRGHTESIVGMAVSPDGKLLATGDFRRAIQVRDIASGEIVHSFFGHRAAIWGLSFAPDSQQLVSASDDGDIVVWDLREDSILRRFSVSAAVIRSAVFSPDSRYLLFGDTHLRRLRYLNLEEITGWIADNRVVQSLSCAEQGSYSLIPLCDENNTIRAAQIGENRGEVYRDAGLTWTLDARAGDVLTIRVQADQPASAVRGIERRQILGLLDTVLTLVSPSNVIVATNDDSADGDTNSALVNITLPEDGAYRIEVGSLDDATSGSYTLIIEQAGINGGSG